MILINTSLRDTLYFITLDTKDQAMIKKAGKYVLQQKFKEISDHH